MFTVAPPAGYVLEAAANRQSFALSPDGRRLAFTAMAASGVPRVFMRDLRSLAPRPVPDSDGAHTVFWPPNGSSLFFSAQGKLRRLPFGSGASTVICDAPWYMQSGAWFDRDMLLIGDRSASYTVSPSGGTPQPLNGVYPWPQALPGDRHVLYVQWDARVNRFQARVARVGERPVRIRLASCVHGFLYQTGHGLPDVHSVRQPAGPAIRRRLAAIAGRSGGRGR
jgi:hypothetical protein